MMGLIPVLMLIYSNVFIACQAVAVERGSLSGKRNYGYLGMPVKKIYAKPPLINSLSKRSEIWKRADYDEAILDNQDGFYSVELEIGTPSQAVTVMLDTGSSDIYVLEASNPYCKGSSEAYTSTPNAASDLDCEQYGTYAPSRSSTFVKNDTDFHIVYGDGDFATGYWGLDSISIGNSTIQNANFAVSNNSNTSFGTFGLGLTKEESTYNGGHGSFIYENFPVLLKKQGIIMKSAYSLLLNNTDAEEGNILFGAVDHNKYSGQLYTLPLVSPDDTNGTPSEFYITVQGIAIKSGSKTDTLTTTPFPALIDSGTTEMLVPLEYVKLISENINYEYNSSMGAYTGACPTKNTTEFLFDFGGFTISNNLANYIGPVDDDGKLCYLRIYDSGADTAIFGDIFLVNTYAVFDLDDLEISLAQARYNETNENIELISSNVPGAIKAPGYSSSWTKSQSVSSGGNIFTAGSTTSGESTRKNLGYRVSPSSFYVMISLLYSLIT